MRKILIKRWIAPVWVFPNGKETTSNPNSYGDRKADLKEGTGIYTDFDTPATWLAWTHQTEDAGVHYPSAIVQFEDGTCETALLSSIKFVDIAVDKQTVAIGRFADPELSKLYDTIAELCAAKDKYYFTLNWGANSNRFSADSYSSEIDFSYHLYVSEVCNLDVNTQEDLLKGLKAALETFDKQPEQPETESNSDDLAHLPF